MAGFADFLLIFFFLIVPTAAILTQIVPIRLGEVRFRDTDLSHAWGLVHQYAAGTFEQRFGYPTGYFYLDEQRSSQPSRILMREAQPAGVVTDGCVASLGSASLSGFDGGCAAGCMGIFVIGFIGAPFFLISVLDRFFRLVLRSRVDVLLTQAGPDVTASFSFYGPGGYSLRSRYAKVFEKPALPAILGFGVPGQDAAPPVVGPQSGAEVA